MSRLILIFLSLLLISCLERKVYLSKAVLVTCKGDTIEYYGGEVLYYSDGVVKIETGNE